MRCLACDSLMSDRDASRKYVATGEHLDLCQYCYETIADQIEVTENYTLSDVVESHDDNSEEVSEQVPET